MLSDKKLHDDLVLKQTEIINNLAKQLEQRNLQLSAAKEKKEQLQREAKAGAKQKKEMQDCIQKVEEERDELAGVYQGTIDAKQAEIDKLRDQLQEMREQNRVRGEEIEAIQEELKKEKEVST